MDGLYWKSLLKIDDLGVVNVYGNLDMIYLYSVRQNPIDLVCWDENRCQIAWNQTFKSSGKPFHHLHPNQARANVGLQFHRN